MTSDEPLEDLYFNWLVSKVSKRRGRTPSTSYDSLLYAMHSTEFSSLLVGDDNRAADGKELRHEFLTTMRLNYPDKEVQALLFLECSVLEMLVAFTVRAAFNTRVKAKDWFWIFVDNLGLSEISDAAYRAKKRRISPALNTFIWREYDSLGHGGLFPLSESRNNQREVEVWYQFCEYLIDQNIY